jgi:hypothetical protein
MSKQRTPKQRTPKQRTPKQRTPKQRIPEQKNADIVDDKTTICLRQVLMA